MDMQMERIRGVLGKDCARNPENSLRFLKFLQRNVKASYVLTGIEAFEWELPFLTDGWGGAEYEEIKVRKPSFTDQFELQELTAPDEGSDDIVACVKRISDQKDFKIRLSQLEGMDFKEESFQFLEDYVTWYKHY